MKTTLVLALGNPLRGDDGLALAVLELLQQQALPPGVTLLDGGTPGLETVLILQGYDRALLIDAAEMGLAPGEWRRFTPDQAALKLSDLPGTLHYAGVAEALALGAALDILPAELVIYGVQPASLGWEQGLSEPVQTALNSVVKAISSELSDSA